MAKELTALEDVLDAMATAGTLSDGIGVETLAAVIVEALAAAGYRIVFDDSVSA